MKLVGECLGCFLLLNNSKIKSKFMRVILCLSISLIAFATANAQPLNDILDRKVIQEKPVLKYPSLRENDLMWEKRIWRVIDVREKMNQVFAYPNASLFEIMVNASKEGAIELYSTEDDAFSRALTASEVNQVMSSTDTVEVFDPITYVSELRVVFNKINPEDIKRYRLKEIWYFDSHTSTMKNRILGIAPMKDVYDESGNFLYEKPLFWMHYPSARDVLAREVVFNRGNDGSRMTWEDLLEMRMFSSHVYKESNIGDSRLQDHYSGLDLLLQADKINQELFNYEQDVWSY